MTCTQATNPKSKTIAIVGSGVSGLTCAHYLVMDHAVTIFEANEYLGGHVNTLDVTLKTPKKFKKDNLETSAIDTGFIVFNERTYPNFFRLLAELDVPIQKTDMSFSVKNPAINFEYNGHTLNSLLSQRRNIISPKFWRFAKDIITFNKQLKQRHKDYKDLNKAINTLSLSVEQLKPLDQQSKLDKRRGQKLQNQLANKIEALEKLSQETLEYYLKAQKYSQLFQENYLLPMVSAIWSMQIERTKSFPLILFAQFFDNHGLLDIINRPQWFTIKGGSKQYVNKLIQRYAKMGGNALVNSPVQSITRHSGGYNNVGVTINYKDASGSHKSAIFDEVIFACHADVAKRLLTDINEREAQVLSAFSFTDNEAILHTDTSILPNKRLGWASWNYLLPNTAQRLQAPQPQGAQLQTSQVETYQSVETYQPLGKGSQLLGDELKPVLTYHMNILQRLLKNHNYLVTLNKQIDNAQVIKRIHYRHPVYDIKITLAQKQWYSLASQDNHTHFCGAYWFNGFHEDGVRSGLRVCQHLGVNIDSLDTVNPAHLTHVIEPDPLFNDNKLPLKADKNPAKLSERQLISARTNTPLNELFTSNSHEPLDKAGNHNLPHSTLTHQILTGTTWHVRHLPSKHEFNYPYRYWGLSLNRLAAGDFPDTLKKPWHNLHYFDFNDYFELTKLDDTRYSNKRYSQKHFKEHSTSSDNDYLSSTATTDKRRQAQIWRDKVLQQFERLTDSQPTGDILAMVTNRNLGFYFSPVNFYIGFDNAGNASHLLAEISNTPWDKRHFYGFKLSGNQSEFSHHKDFHVSPFNPLDQRYNWKVKIANISPLSLTQSTQNDNSLENTRGLKQITLSIQVADSRGKVFAAGINMTPQAMTTVNITRALIKNPVMNYSSMGRIYWHALLIYVIKKVPYVGYNQSLDDSNQSK